MRRPSVCAVIPLLAILFQQGAILSQVPSQRNVPGSLSPLGAIADDSVISKRYWAIRPLATVDADTVVSAGFWKIVVPNGTATILVDTIRAKAGDLVSVPLRLRNVQSVKLNTVIQTDLRFNATLLAPAGSTPAGMVTNGDRLIAVSAPLTVPGSEGVLTTLQFIAMLGNAEGTPLRLENSRAASGQVVLAEIPGYFILTDICREGGTRLYTATGNLGLFQNRPNPFNATTSIEYEVIEAGATRLLVLDMLGRVIATLVDGTVLPGRYTVSFDSATLPSGSYMALLLTPTDRRTIIMNVMK